MRSLLIDTDTASDDAVALIMALRNAYARVHAVTVVAGNVPLPQAVANAIYTCDLCARNSPDGVRAAETRPAPPVYAGCARPLIREPSHADWFHGKDGLG